MAFAYHFGIFDGGFFADFGLSARAETSGQFRTDGEFDGGVGVVQSLQIGIRDDKIDVLETGRHHAVYRIGAAAARADYLDNRWAYFFLIKHFIIHEFPPPRKN